MATTRPTARPTSPLPENAVSGRLPGAVFARTPAGAPALPLAAGAAAPAAQEPPKPALPALREIVTAVIGLGIVLVTLVLAWRLFEMNDVAPRWTASPSATIPPERFDPYQRGKDVLLLLLPLAGAIVGYYTGRVIADRTIDQANQTARTATATATQAQTTAGSARAETEQVKQAKQDVKADAERLAELARRRRSGSGALESVGTLEAPGRSSDPDDDEVDRILARIRAR